MKFIVEDFNYKGKHYDRHVFELPDHITNIDEVPMEKLGEYILDVLELVDDQEEG